ncbi:MAG: DUF6268 family outer membrane beta-barrel protein [Chitinophagaceae bacterium]
MKRKIFKLAIGCICLFPCFTSAQDIFSWAKNSGYCNPSVVGLPRAKAFIFKYELLPAFTIKTTAKQGNFENAVGHINRNRRIDLRLRFPIINKPSFTLAAGIKYTHEEFIFNANDLNNGYAFYNNLEDRPLKSIGFHVYALKPTRSNKYFVLRASFDLNGDYTSKNLSVADFLKFSITPMIGWKKDENLSYAIGASYGYTFGKPLIIPVLSVNKNFSCNFGIESLLPVNIRLRYSPNENNYLYTGFELSGASFRLENNDPVFEEYKRLHLFRSELRYTINYERCIHDWLWAGIEAGWRKNLRFNVTNAPGPRSSIILSNQLSDAIILNASIFIVPPKGLLRKNQGHVTR